MAWVPPTLVRSLITHLKAHIYGDSIFFSGDGLGQPSGVLLYGGGGLKMFSSLQGMPDWGVLEKLPTVAKRTPYKTQLSQILCFMHEIKLSDTA